MCPAHPIFLSLRPCSGNSVDFHNKKQPSSSNFFFSSQPLPNANSLTRVIAILPRVPNDSLLCILLYIGYFRLTTNDYMPLTPQATRRCVSCIEELKSYWRPRKVPVASKSEDGPRQSVWEGRLLIDRAIEKVQFAIRLS